jgi:hypothetical protein
MLAEMRCEEVCFAKVYQIKVCFIKRLREMGLFRKEDIQKYDLLWFSCNGHSPKRFHYFADWDPSALKQSVILDERSSILNMDVKYGAGGDEFQLAFGATLRFYPHELGLYCSRIPKVIHHFKKQEMQLVKKRLGN